jgi:hypothetical protein
MAKRSYPPVGSWHAVQATRERPNPQMDRTGVPEDRHSQGDHRHAAFVTTTVLVPA